MHALRIMRSAEYEAFVAEKTQREIQKLNAELKKPDKLLRENEKLNYASIKEI